MSFDFCGKSRGREKYTDYGKLVHGSMGGHQGMTETTEPSVRASKWYHWALMARRSLTVLERMPEVDPQRLGIFGISVGGSLVWYVAGTDDRVKATCAIYGCGWNTHPKSIYAEDPKRDDPSTVLWRKTMEPESYAPLVTRPLLFLDGTNDHHGKMDWAYTTLASMKAPWHAAFTPYYRHHVEEEQGRDLPLFMDACLRGGPAWPKTPELKITLDEAGVPQATLRSDASRTIKKVEIYYAVRNENPITRYWRPVSSSRNDQVWTAVLPISNPRDRLFAFANVQYASGICLSSKFQTVVPAELGPTKATDRPSLLIGDFSHGLDGFTTSSPGTDPNRFTPVMETVTGPDGIPGLHMLGRVIPWTTKLNDPEWQAPLGAKLSFLIQTSRTLEFDVVLIENDYTLDSVQYVHHVKLEKKAGWQEVVLSPDDFKTEKNRKGKKSQVLGNWRPFDSLEFGSKGGDHTDGVTFANIRWVVQ
jgi:dienelactone hydrolase